MARQTQRWSVGLVPLAILWFAATAYEVGEIETDISTRGAAALGARTLDQPGLAVSGRDASIAGAAFADNGRQAARNSVSAVAGVRLVNTDALTLLVAVKPYLWSASRDGGNIALAGGAPNPDARASIVKAARAIPAAALSDAMVYARGETSSLAAGSAFALGQLALMTKGEAGLSDGALTISGETPDSASYEKITIALANLPIGLTLAKADIFAPLATPYVWSARRDGAS